MGRRVGHPQLHAASYLRFLLFEAWIRREKSFDRLGERRCAAITLVSADAAEWIANVVVVRAQLRQVFAL